MKTAVYWIKKLKLRRHSEGGFYRETYRSAAKIRAKALPAVFGGARPFGTAIYFLLTAGKFSAFHRIASDELWHFYAGSPVTLYVIDLRGRLSRIRIGSDCEKGDVFQYAVKGGCWMAAEVEKEKGYALVGCTVSPGFDYRNFELASRRKLAKRYPRHQALIVRLTRGEGVPCRNRGSVADFYRDRNSAAVL